MMKVLLENEIYLQVPKVEATSTKEWKEKSGKSFGVFLHFHTQNPEIKRILISFINFDILTLRNFLELFFFDSCRIIFHREKKNSLIADSHIHTVWASINQNRWFPFSFLKNLLNHENQAREERKIRSHEIFKVHKFLMSLEKFSFSYLEKFFINMNWRWDG